MQIDTIKKTIEADLKRNGFIVKKVIPEGKEQVTDLKAFLMKKYFSGENISLIIFVDVIREGRSDEEIERALKEMKERTLRYVESEAPVNINGRLSVKTKYKII